MRRSPSRWRIDGPVAWTMVTQPARCMVLRRAGLPRAWPHQVRGLFQLAGAGASITPKVTRSCALRKTPLRGALSFWATFSSCRTARGQPRAVSLGARGTVQNNPCRTALPARCPICAKTLSLSVPQVSLCRDRPAALPARPRRKLQRRDFADRGAGGQISWLTGTMRARRSTPFSGSSKSAITRLARTMAGRQTN